MYEPDSSVQQDPEKLLELMDVIGGIGSHFDHIGDRCQEQREGALNDFRYREVDEKDLQCSVFSSFVLQLEQVATHWVHEYVDESKDD